MGLGPPDLSSVPAAFSFPVTRRRYAAAAVVKGRASRGAATDTPSDAHVFPATGKTLERFAAGNEDKRIVEGHSDKDWRVETGELPSDVLLYDGEQFELVDIGRWNEGPAGDPSWKAFVAIQVTRP